MTDKNLQDNHSSLASLQNQQGRLSRLIGEAKKNHQDCDQLIAEMRVVSAQIKHLIASTKQPMNPQPETNTEETPTPGLFAFLAPKMENAPQIKIVEVNSPNGNSQLQQQWNDYVNENPRCSAYHHFEFKAIIQKAFNQTPHYFLAQDSQSNTVGILPAVQLQSRLFGNFIISMPYFNYGGPIADHPDIEELLIQALIQKAKRLGVDHVEIRDVQSRKNYQARTDKVAMLLSLPNSEQDLWQQVGSKVRAQIKKAKSHDLTFRIGGQELLNDFYQVFVQNMRDLGTPVYGRDFFATLLDTLKKSSDYPQIPEARLALVYDDSGKPISAGFLISHKETVEIPWASTLRSANSLNANMFLYWQILANTVNQGFKFFDFGRSSKEAGTFKFKKQWGAKPQQLFWHYWLPNDAPLPSITTNNPKYNIAIKIWQRLPLWLTRMVGPRIVKNIP